MPHRPSDTLSNRGDCRRRRVDGISAADRHGELNTPDDTVSNIPTLCRQEPTPRGFRRRFVWRRQGVGGDWRWERGWRGAAFERHAVRDRDQQIRCGSRSARKNQPHARAGSRGELSTSGIAVERPQQRESQRACQEQDRDQHHLKHLLLRLVILRCNIT